MQNASKEQSSKHFFNEFYPIKKATMDKPWWPKGRYNPREKTALWRTLFRFALLEPSGF